MSEDGFSGMNDIQWDVCGTSGRFRRKREVRRAKRAVTTSKGMGRALERPKQRNKRGQENGSHDCTWRMSMVQPNRCFKNSFYNLKSHKNTFQNKRENKEKLRTSRGCVSKIQFNNPKNTHK